MNGWNTQTERVRQTSVALVVTTNLYGSRTIWLVDNWTSERLTINHKSVVRPKINLKTRKDVKFYEEWNGIIFIKF